MVNSNESLKTPILFLVFNRPSCTEKVFKEIAAARPTKLYVAADGARQNNPGEADLCAQVRTIATKVDWDCELKILFREKNLGCRLAVSSAINWFFFMKKRALYWKMIVCHRPSFLSMQVVCWNAIVTVKR